ncbi:MAG: acyl carrier protein [Phycisphaerales bacterium]|nr:MAG: acyl carrier protein [Phycisphaerales bacterium]
MPPSRQELFTKVREVLVDALGVDEDEVTEDAKLEADLGAESIDYLDIVFRLEKTFGIKIPKNELFPDDILNNPDYVDGERLTPAGLDKLRSAMPHADFGAFEESAQVSEIPNLFTVSTIVNFVNAKLAESAAA